MAKIRSGIVASVGANKTIVVKVDRMVPHKKYGKRYRVSTRFAVHDELGTATLGQNVVIEECRPISKTKSWRLVTPGQTTSETNALEKVAPAAIKPVKKPVKAKAKTKAKS